MKAYPITQNLKEAIIEEQNLRARTGEFWCRFKPIEGTDYLGLAENNLTAVLQHLLRKRASLLRDGFTWDSQPIQRNKEMFQEVTDLIFQ
ncbi:MAG: hypothetical protein GWP24_04830 [Alphaproteobacteria bacterium]|nr:hypothetical protein [Alphaproteobacteria bacterium]